MRQFNFKIVLFVFSSLFVFSPAFAQAQDDVLERLQAINGMQVDETTSGTDRVRGLRRFALNFEQPVDHFDPASEKFRQKLVLFHRGYAEPVVLQTSGYAIFGEELTQLARDFESNQVQVEHRYFAGSVPASKDWSKLTVRQSAEDFHRIVAALKPLYAGKWVNTGASKGGMTSVYFRRYYPADLDGTVADVAPLSFSTEDERYVDFVDNVGGEKYSECRAKIEALQVELLKRRAEILPQFSGEFTTLGDKDTAFEHAVIELPFAFWQYGSPTGLTGCTRVPAPGASAEKLFAFMQAVNDPSNFSDGFMQMFQPYFYQSAAELGAPAGKRSHLRDLLVHEYTLEQYLPDHKPVAYDGATMVDMKSWVANQGQGLMFVYGEYDPWTAGAWTEINSAEGSDNHWFLAPAANHGATYTELAAADRTKAMAVLSRWFDKAPLTQWRSVLTDTVTLEEIELQARRRLRLR